MDYIEISLTRGLVARANQEDAERLVPYKWHAVTARNTFYAARRQGTKTIYMHRAVMGVDMVGREVFVDHKNHDGLDNRRCNLRLTDPKGNAANRRLASDFLGLRGVRLVGDCWHAEIRVGPKLVFLGSFPTQREAGIAFVAASRALGREE